MGYHARVPSLLCDLEGHAVAVGAEGLRRAVKVSLIIENYAVGKPPSAPLNLCMTLYFHFPPAWGVNLKTTPQA